jgi:hypothetical protein
MSRFMQIRIHLEPVYRPDLQSHFPRLSKTLEALGISAQLCCATLYHLVRELERAVYGDIDPALRRTLERHTPVLVRLRGEVEEKLAAWKLEGLDELLYRMEDAFQELERELN